METLEDRLVLSNIFSYQDAVFLPGNIDLVSADHVDLGGGNRIIQLTPNSANQIGSAIIDSPGHAVRSFHMESDVSIKDSTSAKPGDGISFGYGPLSGNAFGESGEVSRGGVWMSIDTFANNSSDQGITLWNNGAQIAHWSTGVDALRGSWKYVYFGVRNASPTSGVLDVYHPAIGWQSRTLSTWNPQSHWRFGVGGRTGSAWDWHVLENLFVTDDNSAPTITTSGAGSFTDASNRSLSWTASDPDSDPLSVSAQLWKNGVAISGRTSSAASSSLSTTASDLTGAGPWNFQVKVSASDGQASAVNVTSSTLVISDDDTTAPALTIRDAQNVEISAAGKNEITSQNQKFIWSVQDSSNSTSTVTITRTSPFPVSDSLANGAKPAGWTLTTNLDGTRIYSRSYTSNISSDSFDFNALGVGQYDITINAADQDNDRTGDSLQASRSRTVTVTNSPPSAVINISTPAAQRLEGAGIEFNASASSDFDGPIRSYVWNFGDGTLANTASATHVFADNGIYPVTLRVSDGEEETSITQNVLISNVAPVLSVVAPESTDEAATFFVNLAVTDPGNDRARIYVDWGDGQIEEFASAGSKPHVYFNGGQQHSIRISLQDEDGTYADQYVGTIDVSDAAPKINGLPEFFTSEAGIPIEIDVAVTDGASDTLLYSWDFGDGTLYEGSGLDAVTHAYAANGIYPVTLSVSDSDGLSATTSAQVSVGVPVSFTAVDQVVAENNGAVVIAAQLDNGAPLDHDVIIPLVITGTASESDFELAGWQIVIAAGEISGSVAVEIDDDALNEDTEQLIVGMGLTSGASHGTVGQQLIQILDDDEQPSVFFTTTSQTVEESVGSIALTASLDRVSGRDVVIPLAFAGTATPGVDFELAAPVSILIPAGSLTGSFDLKIVDDGSLESAQGIVVSMLPSGQAELATAPGQATELAIIIAANDAPLVSWNAAYRLTAEGVPAIQLRANLSHFADQRITVPFTISGTADFGFDYQIAESALVFLPGMADFSMTVAINNDSSQEPIENFVVQLQQPPNAILGVSQTVLTDILDNDIVQVSFEADDIDEFEGTTAIPIKVTLSTTSATATTVAITRSGDAVLNNDFTITASEVSIPAGLREGILHVSLADNNVHNASKTIYLALGNVTGGVLGQHPFKTIIIKNNDPLVNIRNDQVSVTEGAGPGQFAIELSEPTNHTVIVPVQYSGTAYRDSDYTAPSTVLVPAGATTATFSVLIADDSSVEPMERLDVTLGAPSGGILGSPNTVSLSIPDNDVEIPDIFWRSQSYSIPENAGSVEVQIGITQAVPYDVSAIVNYSIFNTARPDEDFRRGVSSITIPAGSTGVDVSIVLVDDEIEESDESFSVSLSGATNAHLSPDASMRRTLVTILNEDSLSKAEIQQFNDAALGKITSNVSMFGLPSPTDLIARYHASLKNGDALDAILTVASAIPLPGAWELVPWTVEWLREEYPLDHFPFIDGGQVREDAKYDWFWGDWAVEMGKRFMLQWVSGKLAEYLEGVLQGVEGISGDLVELVNDIGSVLTTNAAGKALAAGLTTFTEKYIEANPLDVGHWAPVADAENAVQAVFSGGMHAGYASGSLLFFDTDFNRARSTFEPFGYTLADGSVFIQGIAPADANGNFVLEASDGQWVSEGGTDTSVNQPFQFSFVAPATYSMITPSSTLVSKLVDIGAFSRNVDGVRQAETRYLTAFGLADRSLPDLDFLRAAAEGDNDAAALFATETEFYNTVVMAASLFGASSTGLSFPFLADIVIEDIAAKIASSDASLKLDSAIVVANILRGVSVRTGISIAMATLNAVADSIARANSLIEQIPVAGSSAFLEAVVKVQSVSHGFLSDAIKQVASGQLSAAQFASNTSTAQLNSRVAKAQAFNLLPVYLAVSNASIEEGADGSKTMTFFVMPYGDSSLPVSVHYQSSDINAENGDDYIGTSGTLTWAPGDASARAIEITIVGDTALEADESFSVLLADATNATILIGQGTGIIRNDDAFHHETEDDEVNHLVLSLNRSDVILEQDGVVIFEGSFGNGATLDLSGQAADRLSLFSGKSVWISQAIELDGTRTIETEGHSIRISGIGAIEDEVTTSITGLSAPIFAEFPRTLLPVVPVSLDPAVISYQWEVIPAGSDISVETVNTPTFSFVPAEGYWQVALTVSDGVKTSTVRQNIFVYPSNVPPAAIDDSASTTENATINVDVISNDFELNPTETLSLLSGSASLESMIADQDGLTIPNVTASISTSGNGIEFDPGTDFEFLAIGETATVTIRYVVTDDHVEPLTDSGTLSVAVIGLNDVPRAVITYIGEIRTEGSAISVTGSGSDVDASDTLTYAWAIYKNDNLTAYDSGEGIDWSFSPDDNGSYQIVLTVTDNHCASVSVTETIIVANELPEVAITNAPMTSVQGKGIVLSSTVYDAGLIDAAHGYDYAWTVTRDGIAFDLTEIITNAPQFQFMPTEAASYSITLTVRDKDDGVSSASQTIGVTAAQGAVLHDDLLDGGKVLVVGGTPSNDHIVINPAGPGQLRVSNNGLSQSFSGVGRIVVFGQSGDDDIQVASGVDVRVWLYGGVGNDRLKGGANHNVLLGGDGDDRLQGGSGRDVLIGGRGADHILGNENQDILISGATALDANLTALTNLHRVWSSGHDTSVRVAAVSSTYLKTGPEPTVFDDASADKLTGGADAVDWFFANLHGEGVLDQLTDLGSSESVLDL